MKIHTSGVLEGAYIIEPEPIIDERGFFAEALKWNVVAIPLIMIQWNIAFNTKKGTLRGMHYQEKPDGERKIVRCIRGKIFDVILNVKTGEWSCLELSAENRLSLYIPEGYAHGYQTLEDNTEVFYGVSNYYNPKSARTVKWNEFGIKWPLEVTAISVKDK